MKRFLKFLTQLSSLRIGIYITILMLFAIWYRPVFLEGLEAKAYDLRFRVRGEKPGAKEIVLIALDEKSIAKLGRWPWPRIYWAEFFKIMNQYQPKVIALDVIFSEPDQNINLQFLEKLKEYYLSQGRKNLNEKINESIKLLDAELEELAQLPGKKALREEVRKIRDSLALSLSLEKDDLLLYLNELEQEANTDQALADALALVNNEVLGWFFFQTQAEAQQTSPEENLKRLEQLKPYAIKVIKYKYGSTPFTLAQRVSEIFGFQVNLPIFAQHLSGTGYFTAISDSDGVLRSAPLVAGWPEARSLKNPEEYHLFPSLSLEALRIFLAQDPVVVVNESGVESIRFGDYQIPVDEAGRMLINFQGNLSQFQVFSFYDVITDFAELRKEKDFKPEVFFQDKIVLVGPTAVAIYDVWTTPFGIMPGVMSHANIIDNILYQRALYRPSWMYAFDMLALALLGILLSLIFPKIRPIYSAGLALVLVMGYSWFNYYLFNHYHYSLTLVYPILSLVLVYMGITVYHYAMEEREKRFIRNAFSLYLSQEVIEELCADPKKLKLGGERKRITIFFSDLAGFTSMSEKMAPEQLVHLLNQYLTEMSEIILKHKGLIDKFEGDAIMAFFGAPVDYPDHALKACLASLEMQEKLKELNQRWAEQNLPRLSFRVGLNTGVVLVGNMGSMRRMDYTVIGDEVNLASRLEGANKAYGTNLMISESTYLEVKEAVEVRELDLIQVMGKEKPVRVYELLAKKGELEPRKKELMENYYQGLQLYRAQNFAEALSLFKKCLELVPDDPPSKVYLERCQDYLENPPPPDWDGIFRLTKK